jgi:phosphoenolpyruvate synthase/pyruvate phosphate dikinase
MKRDLTRLLIKEKEMQVILDTDLDADCMKDLCDQYLPWSRRRREAFSRRSIVQLRLAIESLSSPGWKAAVAYRKEFGITPEMANGTAVNVCTMVFGNMGFDSATGVALTRDPGTGENSLYGEYLTNAQGEDVVAGIRTPKPIQEMKKEMPKTYRELERVRRILEQHFHEVQDFEFTVEKETLYILQTQQQDECPGHCENLYGYGAGKADYKGEGCSAIEAPGDGTASPPENRPQFQGKAGCRGACRFPGGSIREIGLRCRRSRKTGKTG